MGQSQSLCATYKLTRSVYLGQRDPIRFSNILLTFFLCILELNRKWLKGHALKSDVEYICSFSLVSCISLLQLSQDTIITSVSVYLASIFVYVRCVCSKGKKKKASV